MWNISYPSMRAQPLIEGVSNRSKVAQALKTNLRTMLRKKRPDQRAMLSTSLALVVFVICYMNSSTTSLESIRRILCLENSSEARSAYINESQVQYDTKLTPGDLRKLMKPPKITKKRDIPSHVDLCQNFLVNQAIHKAGEPITPVHVSEDEAICKDYKATLPAMFQIMAGEAINSVSKMYEVTYSHDCQQTFTDDTGDGLNWKTVQQEFPASGLVFDDGSISEFQITELCKGCLAEYKALDGKKPWFHPHSTRHCILYPGTSRPLVNDQQELDMASVQQQRKRAQGAPLGKLVDTIEDRFRFLAAKYKSENGSGLQLANGRSIEDEEEEDGVLIFIDEGSMPITRLEVDKYIPNEVGSICVMIGNSCTSAKWENDEYCHDYALTLKKDLADHHSDVQVTFEVSISTAAATSRMIRAKILYCPPGTNACLLPAIAKEEETVAIIGESMGRSNTEEFFDFVSIPRYNLQIANLDDSREVANDMGRSNDLSTSELQEGVGAFSSSGGAGLNDGCVEVRGKNGEWEKDFVYDDLSTHRNSMLRGSSGEDVVPVKDNQRSRGGSTDLLSGGKFRSWTDSNPECELDMLNIHGMCEVVHAMKLGVVQFVGDQYTEKMVRSFWELLGIDDGDVGKVTPSTTNPEKYRKTVHCPKEKISFDIVFTPNEKLTDIAEDVQPIGQVPQHIYVPVATPVTVPVPVHVPVNNVASRTGLYQGPGVSFGYDSGPGVGYSASAVGAGSCWGNPYSSGCCNPAATMRSAVPPPPPPMPQYNPACHCVPFQQQYQYNYATAAQAAQPVQRAAMDVLPGTNVLPPLNNALSSVSNVPPQVAMDMPQGNVVRQYPTLSGRQFIVGAISPNQSLDQYVQSVDQFGKTVTNIGHQDDIFVMQTASEIPKAYGGGRRTQKSNVMTRSEIEKANAYLHRSVEEYRRRTNQKDLLSYDPEKSKLPYVHVLDVSHMTHSHPLSEGKNSKWGHRDLKNVPNLYDHWNHLLYSNMRDMARAELARDRPNIKARKQGAPPGSPYENNVPLFQINN